MVELSSRALDILAALTERPGEVISKRELLELAWPDAVVVDSAAHASLVDGGRLATGTVRYKATFDNKDERRLRIKEWIEAYLEN